jgi:hypothetical protein
MKAKQVAGWLAIVDPVQMQRTESFCSFVLGGNMVLHVTQ